MRTFYFVGGPLPGHAKEFFRRLAEGGGPPPTWHVYPHASGDGRALHLVRAEAEDAITGHLAHFDGIYEASAPTEVVDVQEFSHGSAAATGAASAVPDGSGVIATGGQ